MTKKIDSSAPETTQKKSGTYTAYSASESDNKKSQNRILFFNASWCPTCKSLVKNINANSDGISPGVAILSVDYDANPDLKRQYGVTYQHTFVKIDGEGKLLSKTSGLDTVEEINKFANN